MTLRLDEFWHDLKFAFRQLRHSPGFTLVATLTLALGIGANSAIFALVDATLLRPLPFREPDRLVAIWERPTTNPSATCRRSTCSTGTPAAGRSRRSPASCRASAGW